MSEFGGPWAGEPVGPLGECRAALAAAVAALDAYLTAHPGAPVACQQLQGQLTASLAEVDRLTPECTEA